jgi:hypothetical protein
MGHDRRWISRENNLESIQILNLVAKYFMALGSKLVPFYVDYLHHFDYQTPKATQEHTRLRPLEKTILNHPESIVVVKHNFLMLSSISMQGRLPLSRYGETFTKA